MSVFKQERSPFYRYCFDLHGRRFEGSTKCKDRKDALAIEDEVRRIAEGEIKPETISPRSVELVAVIKTLLASGERIERVEFGADGSFSLIVAERPAGDKQ